MKFRKLVAGAVIVQGVTLLGLPAANANVILTYTGNDFTRVISPYTTADKVTAAITLANPLGDDFTGTVTPIVFTMKDGQQTITNTTITINFKEFDFSTNSIGDITQWNVEVSETNGNDIHTVNSASFGLVGDEGSFSDGTGINLTNPGTWTSTSVTVSEPPTISVLGAGLLGLGLLWWRRRQILDLPPPQPPSRTGTNASSGARPSQSRVAAGASILAPGRMSARGRTYPRSRARVRRSGVGA